MIVSGIQDELVSDLPDTEEVFIAVALAHETALGELLQLIPLSIKLKVLVGVDLPTSTAALTLLKERCKISTNTTARIFYDPDHVFHPKVYLLKKSSSWIGFVGSANLTMAAFHDNIELTHKIVSTPDCERIHEWFNNLFRKGYPVDRRNISALAPVVSGTERKPLMRKPLVLFRDEANSFDDIDFSDRFFKREHHWAFRQELWLDKSLSANKEREEAETRFLELDAIIRPKFGQYGLVNLFPNTDGNIVSRHHQINENKLRKLNAMWLSYGKSQALIKKYRSLFTDKDDKDLQTFIHHTRLQIRIEFMSIGIWMLFGKEGRGSQFDRDFFKKRMANDSSYRQLFFDRITKLPTDYWISVDDKTLNCREFKDAGELHDHCKKDDIEKYFIIGRDYEIIDSAMSEENFSGETLSVFKLLFPLYEMMKHKL